MKNNVEIKKFDSGLCIGCDTMQNVDSVSLIILIKAGSRHEKERQGLHQNGIAHFVEHMAFKGTSKFSKKQIAEELDTYGGNYNAFTSREYTAYVSTMPSDAFEKVFSVMANILLHSTFENEEIELEKNVILQEIAMTYDAPDDLIFDKLYESSFPDQAFGRSILGTAKNIESFNRQSVVDFVNEHYTPENISICVAGKITLSELEDFTKNYLPELTKKPDSTLYKAKSDLELITFKSGEYRENRNLEQVHIAISFPGTAKTSPHYWEARALSTILGGGMSSKLFQEIRENSGLAYDVMSFQTGYENVGTFGIYGAISPANHNSFLQKVIKEIKKLEEKVDDFDLLKVKTQLRSKILMSVESTASRAKHLAYSLAQFGTYRPTEDVLKDVDSVTAPSIEKFISSMLSMKSVGFAVIGKTDNMMNFNEFQKLCFE